MSNRLLIRFKGYLNSGGVLTWVGDRVNQAVFWSMQCYDAYKDSWWPPFGRLKYQQTKTDKTKCSTNVYLSLTPEGSHYPRKRYGTYYLYGEEITYGDISHIIKYGEDWPLEGDWVKAKWS